VYCLMPHYYVLCGPVTLTASWRQVASIQH